MGAKRCRIYLCLASALAAVCLTLSAAGAEAHLYRGELGVFHTDDFRDGSTTTKYSLHSEGGKRRLLPTRLPSGAAGDEVTVAGRPAGGAIVGAVRAAAPVERAVIGERKTAVILLNFESDLRQPWTADEARARVFTASDSARAFYEEQSRGQTKLVGKLREDGDVFGYYTIGASTATCDISTWSYQARTAATADGVDLSGYNHIVYAFPGQAACQFAGAAEVGWNQSWMNGDLSTAVVAHELGHNMGLHHASSYSCVDGAFAPVAISDSCTLAEYGDRFDVMGGYGDRHSNGWHLDRLGYLAAGDVATVTASGSYALRSAVSPGSAPQLIRIPRSYSESGAVADYYYLEVRSPGGVFDDFDPSDPVVRGVSVRLNPEPTVLTQSRLLDMTPGSGNFFRDAALPVGGTFSDGQVTITTTGVAGGVATVDVAFAPPPPDTQAPTVPVGLTATGHADRVALTWSPSSDDVGVTGYAIFRDGIEIGTTAGTAYDDATAGGEPHAYAVEAYDAAGNRSPRSAAVVGSTLSPAPVVGANPGTGSSPPSTAPTVAAAAEPAPAVPAARARLQIERRRRGRSLRLRVLAEGGRVDRIELWIDGILRKRSFGTSLSFSWRLRRVRPGVHRIRASAVEPDGGVVGASVRFRRTR